MTTINDLSKDNIQLIIDSIFDQNYHFKFSISTFTQKLIVNVYSLEKIHKNIFEKHIIMYVNTDILKKFKKNKFYSFEDSTAEKEFLINLTDYFDKIQKQLPDYFKIDENGDIICLK